MRNVGKSLTQTLIGLGFEEGFLGNEWKEIDKEMKVMIGERTY